MEWIALLAFLLCLVYLPKFRKVMMWIGIVGGGLGGVGLGVWKIKDHYDQKRLAAENEKWELEQLQKKADRGEGMTLEELTRLGATDAPTVSVPEIEQIRQKAARGQSLTDLEKALLAGGKIVPGPAQPKPDSQPVDRLTPEEMAAAGLKPANKPFDPYRFIGEQDPRKKRKPKKDQAGDWEVVPDPKAP